MPRNSAQMRKAEARRKKGKRPLRILDARPDTLDFRDRMFEPTLIEVPIEIPLATFRKIGAPILDQGSDGACTGFGLATVVHYLLRRRKVKSDTDAISPWMLYALARRYDEWPGEQYSGSSARGAMKGWHKHGVCSLGSWSDSNGSTDLTATRVAEGRERPLGAYLRVNHRDLVAMHAALSEVGVLYATALVHTGWNEPSANGKIEFRAETEGGHAFAIVAYDRDGFWLQNSWGPDWGLDGYAHVSYDDWLENGTDVWVARLGVPVEILAGGAAAKNLVGAAKTEGAASDLRPHILSLGNDGALRPYGTYGTDAASLRELVRTTIPAATSAWSKKRLLLYAHGGLVPESAAVQRVADYREALLAAEVYPLSFIWKSDYWTTLLNMLRDAVRKRRPEGILDPAKDFLMDRLDDALEPLARIGTGKAEWDEMKENALRATISADGGARLAAEEIAQLVAADPSWELHVVGHSAGSILHAPLLEYLASSGPIASLHGRTGLGLRVRSVTLWAPAITVELFAQSYLPLIASGAIERCTLFTLTDCAERDDDCAKVYNKSLLYLVSHAFEATARVPVLRPDGVPILGMEKFLRAGLKNRRTPDTAAEQAVRAAVASGRIEWIQSPNTQAEGSAGAARSTTHGGFDDDVYTVKATLARIVGAKTTAKGTSIDILRSRVSRAERRVRVEAFSS